MFLLQKVNSIKTIFTKEIKTDSSAWTSKNYFAYFKVEDETDVIKSYFTIIESNRDEKIDGIEKFLIDLTHEYDKLKTELELNLSFWEVVSYSPPTEIKKEISMLLETEKYSFSNWISE